MPRAPRRRPPSAPPASPAARPAPRALALLGLATFGLATLGAACTDVAPPTTAPRPRADLGCAAPTACDASAATPAGASGTRQVRILSGRGPNPEGSFTTLRGERTLTAKADVLPLGVAWRTNWRIQITPTDGYLVPVGRAPVNGTVTFDTFTGGVSRWRLPHGSPLAARALAVKFVAGLPEEGSEPAVWDSTVVTQREVDVLRQEYVDFKIPVPAASEVRTPGDVAGATRFTWAQLNQGDYDVAVLTPRLLAKLGEMDAATGGTLTPTSVFRNPAHHRFHISVSGGFSTAQQSQHQYGTAVDVATGRSLAKWNQLYVLAKKLGACAEPLKIATVNHVHADWRPSAPKCPIGW